MLLVVEGLCLFNNYGGFYISFPLISTNVLNDFHEVPRRLSRARNEKKGFSKP